MRPWGVGNGVVSGTVRQWGLGTGDSGMGTGDFGVGGGCGV